MRKPITKYEQKDFLLEADLLKRRRKKKNLTTTELAKAIGASQAAVARIENGENPRGDVKYKMILELFGSPESFSKRLCDLRKYVRKHIVNPLEDAEKFRLTPSLRIAPSPYSLNNYDLRAEVFKKYGDDSYFILSQIERYVRVVEKVNLLKKAIMKSESYHLNVKRNKAAKLSNLQLRTKNLLDEAELSKWKMTLTMGSGRHSHYFGREIVYKIYKLLKRGVKQSVAIHFLAKIMASLIFEKQDIFREHQYIRNYFPPEFQQCNNLAGPDYEGIEHLIREAQRKNPSISKGCRHLISEFLKLDKVPSMAGN